MSKEGMRLGVALMVLLVLVIGPSWIAKRLNDAETKLAAQDRARIAVVWQKLLADANQTATTCPWNK